MHDPFLKSVFADRRMIEILIRTHVRHWTDEIDFATLRPEPTELVSQETLERRPPGADGGSTSGRSPISSTPSRTRTPQTGSSSASGRLRTPALVVVDEIGYLLVTPNGARLFFQLVNPRTRRSSSAAVEHSRTAASATESRPVSGPSASPWLPP